MIKHREAISFVQVIKETMAEFPLSINNPEKSIYHTEGRDYRVKKALDLKKPIATKLNPFTSLSVCVSLRYLRLCANNCCF
jgi:hypothetical protein